VARIARDRGCRVVYFSTDYVFGGDDHRRSAFVESDERAPVNVYGRSKAAGEDAVRDTLADHLIVRTSSLFGATTSRKGWTFPEMIIRRARAAEPLRVVSDQIMAPTYALDLVRVVDSLLQAGATGTVHVTNSGCCSWYEFACASLEMAGIGQPVEAVSATEFPSVARRPAYSCLATERLERLGIEPVRHWRDALRAYLEETGMLA
jgi:dTDP-4-dehydrorhamnose reductase